MSIVENKRLLIESSDTEVSKVIQKFWDSLSDDDKGALLEKAFEYLKGEGASEIWDSLKKGMEDRALTDKDKEALVRKLNIDAKLLDGADTVFTAMDILIQATPTVLGILWDVFQLGPIDEVVAAIPVVGPVLAIITSIFSYLPEGILISIIASCSIDLQRKTIKWLKDIIIHRVLPEPNEVKKFEKELAESFKFNNTTSGFAEEFKLYENLWEDTEKRFRVIMIVDDEEYTYGTYESRDKANEIAMQVRDERDIETYVEEV